MKRLSIISLMLIIVFSLFSCESKIESPTIDKVEPISASKYLTFISEGITTVSLKNLGAGSNPIIYYSYDKINWTQWDYSGLTFTTDSLLYICGNNPSGFNRNLVVHSSYFSAKGDNFSIEGDIMALLDKDKDIDRVPSSCFSYLFFECTGLTSPPDLPATKLESCCYTSMFQGCSSLRQAPSLPATQLAEECYSCMFVTCYSLAKAPNLPATSMAKHCYESMFQHCSSIAKAPELPATKLEESCYASMFSGCTSLTKAPELPATKMEPGCYAGMFKDCTSLASAPELPAKALEEDCYANMFSGCSSLRYVKCLSLDIRGAYCSSNWLNGVANEGTFVKAKSMVNWPKGASGIPEGWTVVDAE